MVDSLVVNIYKDLAWTNYTIIVIKKAQHIPTHLHLRFQTLRDSYYQILQDHI